MHCGGQKQHLPFPVHLEVLGRFKDLGRNLLRLPGSEGRRIIFDDDRRSLQYPEPFIELLLRQKIQTGQGQRCVR